MVNDRWCRAAGLALIAVAPIAATAAPLSGHQATPAIYRAELARSFSAGTWGVSLGTELFSAHDLFVEGDAHRQWTQHVDLAWAVAEGFELFTGMSAVTHTSADAPEQLVQVGDPVLGGKAQLWANDAAAVGVGVGLRFPTSAGGRGVDAGAVVAQTWLAAQVAATERVLVALNAGYTRDQSGELFARSLSAERRFTARLARSSFVPFAVGVHMSLPLAAVELLPFAELSGALAQAALAESPARATLGAKLELGGSGVSIIGGGDLALSGAPPLDGPRLPGIAPWEIFVRLALRNERDEQHASSDVAKPAPASASTYVVRGKVVDGATGRPVSDAIVRVAGASVSALAVDARSGQYSTWRLPSGAGLVRLIAEAPGFRSAEQTVKQGAPDSTLTVDFALSAIDEPVLGSVRVIMKDVRTGVAVRGTLSVPARGFVRQANARGVIDVSELEAGRHDIVITARGYVTQTKTLEVRDNDVVILNVDLAPSR